MMWLPFIKALLNGLWNTAYELEGQAAQQISRETIAEVADSSGSREGCVVPGQLDRLGDREDR